MDAEMLEDWINPDIDKLVDIIIERESDE